MMDEQHPHVAILMATYNGVRFLTQQLDSFNAQDHKNWSLWVSDDGSTDCTKQRIKEFSKQVPNKKIYLLDGPGKGATRNFLSLLHNSKVVADFVALADQDDIWLPNHISRAIQNERVDSKCPLLCCGPTVYIDENSKEIGRSVPLTQKPSFANALVQNIAGGNTMVLNRGAHDLLKKTSPAADVDLHDWWIYQVVSGSGSRIVFDHVPTVHYRQHDQNEIGSNSGIVSKAHRQGSMLGNKLSKLNLRNINALNANKSLLNQESKDLLDRFSELRNLKGLQGLRALKKLGLYRQTPGGMLSLRVAVFLGKL